MGNLKDFTQQASWGKAALPHEDLVQRHLPAALESVAVKDAASSGGHVLAYISVLSPGASIPEPPQPFSGISTLSGGGQGGRRRLKDTFFHSHTLSRT